ncbi:MAG: sarcosine oxidase subunit gamma [Sulfitobacter sp.]
MADQSITLTETTAFGTALPLKIGRAELIAADPGRLSSVSPYIGQSKALSAAMKKAHGLDLPSPNRSAGKGGNRVIWFGRDSYMLAGPPPDPVLEKHGAVTEQSDAWGSVILQGEDAEAVLARLVPVDLRKAVFKGGHTLRSQLQHLNVSITRIGQSRFLIMGFRSMAATLVHDLKTAMEGVDARR